MQSKLVFCNNAISSCFVFFFLIIDLYVLILAIIRQIFNPIIELIIQIKEAKDEMEIQIVTAKARVRKCSM